METPHPQHQISLHKHVNGTRVFFPGVVFLEAFCSFVSVDGDDSSVLPHARFLFPEGTEAAMI